MATRHVLAELLELAASAGLPVVEVESVGGVDAASRVAAGEQFDLVFLAEGALGALAREGHVDAASLTPLVMSQVAVAVPSGAEELAVAASGPAFDDADGVRAALRGATRIGYSTGPSGTALVRMIEQWGMSEEVGDRLVQARAGVPVARMLAQGDVDLGFQQLSELVGENGVRILGVMPPDCAIDTVFCGAVPTLAQDPQRAREVLTFLASDAMAEVKARHSFRSA